MIYRCLCVCERAYMLIHYMHLDKSDLLPSKCYSYPNPPPFLLQKKALALHLRTVSICLKTGGY